MCFGKIDQNIDCFNHYVSFTQNPLLQIPMCIVIPGEETTRTGVKHTGYIQTQVPQDDGNQPATSRLCCHIMVWIIIFNVCQNIKKNWNMHCRVL